MPPKLDRHKTIKEALEFVAATPVWPDTSRLEMEIWELVARNLFDHANNPSTAVVGSMARATKAQKIIMNRMTGTRRTGTHPATRAEEKVIFKDLTSGPEETVEAEVVEEVETDAAV